MKPPWKFLAQLVSRQRPAEKTDPAPEGGNDRKPVEIELKASSGPSPAEPAAAAVGDRHHESQSPDPVVPLAATPNEVEALAPTSLATDGEGQAAEAIVEHEQPVSDATRLASAKVPGSPSSIPKKRPPKTERKARAQQAAKLPVAAGKEPAPHSSSVSANRPFDEAASLDDDIEQLKDQLAKKLRLQNAQLRKMLERFDRS